MFICEKALEIYDDLVKKKPGTSDDTFEFKASRGCFEKFKNRNKIHNIIRHGEAASSNKKAAEKFVVEFNDMIKKESYLLNRYLTPMKQGYFGKRCQTELAACSKQLGLSSISCRLVMCYSICSCTNGVSLCH